MRADTPLEVKESVALAPFTTLGVGGAARWLATATQPAHVAEAHEWCGERRVPLLVLGGGSNLVIADQGFAGLVLRMAIRGVAFDACGETTRVVAGAGEPWDALVDTVIGRGLAGLECLSGIPGTVGGTPIQNVGAYGQEVADAIESVTAFDAARATMVTMTAEECRFAYRTSRFKNEPGRFLVTGVTYRVRPGVPAVRYPDLVAWLERTKIGSPTLGDVREAVVAVRRSKGMVLDSRDPDSRSVGSFFMNPIVPAAAREEIARAAGQVPPAFAAGEGKIKIPAAWLIERAGFHKGDGDGAAAISTKHPLALVNRGGATASDVLRLATRIKRQVADRFGVTLRPEPVFAGFDDDPDVTYLRHD